MTASLEGPPAFRQGGRVARRAGRRLGRLALVGGLVALTGVGAAVAPAVAQPAAGGTSLGVAPGRTPATVRAVRTVGMTVSSLDRAMDFYTQVLDFQVAGAPIEVWGPDYDGLQGVFGLRMRVARLRLGAETLDLTEYPAEPTLGFRRGALARDPDGHAVQLVEP